MLKDSDFAVFDPVNTLYFNRRNSNIHLVFAQPSHKLVVLWITGSIIKIKF